MNDLLKLKTLDDGTDIHLDQNGTFYAIVDDAPLQAGSLSGLIERIERASRDSEKKARANMAIPLLDSDGEAVTATGLHITQGTVLTKPMIKEGDLYPDHPHVKWLLAEWHRARKRLDALRTELRTVEISRRGPVVGNLASYEQRLEAFKLKTDQALAAVEWLTIGPA